MFTNKEEEQILIRLGNKIKRLRIEKGMSQFDLSTEAEIPKNQIGRIERSEINTTIITLHKICRALKIELIDLLKL